MLFDDRSPDTKQTELEFSHWQPFVYSNSGFVYIFFYFARVLEFILSRLIHPPFNQITIGRPAEILHSQSL